MMHRLFSRYGDFMFFSLRSTVKRYFIRLTGKCKNEEMSCSGFEFWLIEFIIRKDDLAIVAIDRPRNWAIAATNQRGSHVFRLAMNRD